MRLFRKFIFLAGDVLSLYVALALALLVRYGLAGFSDSFAIHLTPFSFLFAAWILVLYLADLYRESGLQDKLYVAKKLFTSVLISAIVSVVALYLFPSFFGLTPKTNLFLLSVFFFVFSYIARIGLVRIFTSGATQVLFLGDSPLSAGVMDYLKRNPHAGYRIAEWVKETGNLSFENLTKIVREKNIAFVITSANISKNFLMLHAIYRLLPLEVACLSFLNFYERLLEKVPLEELGEDWFINNISTRRPLYDGTKKVWEIILALCLSIIFIPVGLIIAFGIKITSRGPAVYKQRRVGKNGVHFILYKFRTMYNNADGPFWTEANDKRVTPFGKFLRFTHLDEIPQLWNILKNDISFIGPRPERIELVEQYKKFPYYEMRHIVKPGLTGWAQVSYRPSASLEEAYEKLQYDIYYIKNRSLFLDFLILVRTVRCLFTTLR